MGRDSLVTSPLLKLELQLHQRYQLYQRYQLLP